jgi:SAM-dependent methyltransferase
MTKKKLEFNPKKLRIDYFGKYFPYDEELAGIIEEQTPDIKKSHSFLVNPLSQNFHIYLVEYFLAFARKWLGKNCFSVLDWGCGKCQVSYLLQKKNIEVVSCDVAGSKYGDSAFSQETPIANYANIKVIPLEHEYILPFPDKSFDIVLSFGVLEHVPNDKQSLTEINRILKSNGLFFCFFLPCKYSWRNKIIYMNGNRYHDHFYNRNIIKKLLNETRFSLIDMWYRDMLPLKSKVRGFLKMERCDNWFCRNTFLKYFASNIEFVANKKG